MKHRVQVGQSFDELARRDFEIGERAVTRGMARAAREIQSDWRSQISGSGLGRRVANSVRSAAYPKGDVSMNAAALIWTRAPKIVAAHNEGALIRSADGFWLAIPLPAAGRGRGGKRTTPKDWEQRTGRSLQFIYRKGRSALLVDQGRYLNRKLADPVKWKSTRRVRGANKSIPIFVLVPQARLKKKFDLQSSAMRIAARVPGWIVTGMKG